MSNPRQYTFFVYLHDVASGGETHFPQLAFKMKPKKDAALFGENHETTHSRHHEDSLHAGLPVLEGVQVRSAARHRVSLS
jgi:prolyl 4-hydroxylase